MMRNIKIIAIIFLFLSFVFAPAVHAIGNDPPGCFSNGDCTAAETVQKCPDCSGALESDEGYETESESVYTRPQDTGVTLPVVSPSPSPTPLVEEPFSIRPFVLLLIFVLVMLIIGYIVFRVRRSPPPQ